MPRKLSIAFNEVVAGVFSLTSGLDGTDVLSDVGLFDGTFDDVSDDMTGTATVTAGTDKLAGTVQASNMRATVARVDDPGFWNPVNPASPLNGVFPGFEEMRPGRLTETTAAGTEYGVFFGFLRDATFRTTTRSCELYFEDLLFRAGRVFPNIPSTGPTTTGAAIGLVLDAMGVPWPEWRRLAVGDAIDDFSADESKSALQLFAELVAAERGTVFVDGDGIFVYESRGMPRTRLSSGTLSTTDNLEELEVGISADSRFSRVSVTHTDPIGGDTTWTHEDAALERRIGESEAPPVSSPYVPLSSGQDLADDIVFEGSQGKPPATATAAAIGDDDPTLDLILSSPLQTVFDVDDPVGNTDGVYVLQGKTHRLDTGIHRVTYTLTRRVSREFALDSGLDGPDVLRY